VSVKVEKIRGIGVSTRLCNAGIGYRGEVPGKIVDVEIVVALRIGNLRKMRKRLVLLSITHNSSLDSGCLPQECHY
jgi:hypothetical protein